MDSFVRCIKKIVNFRISGCLRELTSKVRGRYDVNSWKHGKSIQNLEIEVYADRHKMHPNIIVRDFKEPIKDTRDFSNLLNERTVSYTTFVAAYCFLKMNQVIKNDFIYESYRECHPLSYMSDLDKIETVISEQDFCQNQILVKATSNCGDIIKGIINKHYREYDNLPD